MTTTTEIPPALLSACTVLQSVTIFYPVTDVPDLLRSNGRRPIRPRQVKIYATRLNDRAWTITSPLVIGREVLKSGASGLVDRNQPMVFDNEHPQWLKDVVASVHAALDGQR